MKADTLSRKTFDARKNKTQHIIAQKLIFCPLFHNEPLQFVYGKSMMSTSVIGVHGETILH